MATPTTLNLSTYGATFTGQVNSRNAIAIYGYTTGTGAGAQRGSLSFFGYSSAGNLPSTPVYTANIYAQHYAAVGTSQSQLVFAVNDGSANTAQITAVTVDKDASFTNLGLTGAAKINAGTSLELTANGNTGLTISSTGAISVANLALTASPTAFVSAPSTLQLRSNTTPIFSVSSSGASFNQADTIVSYSNTLAFFDGTSTITMNGQRLIVPDILEFTQANPSIDATGSSAVLLNVTVGSLQQLISFGTTINYSSLVLANQVAAPNFTYNNTGVGWTWQNNGIDVWTLEANSASLWVQTLNMVPSSSIVTNTVFNITIDTLSYVFDSVSLSLPGSLGFAGLNPFIDSPSTLDFNLNSTATLRLADGGMTARTTNAYYAYQSQLDFLSTNGTQLVMRLTQTGVEFSQPISIKTPLTVLDATLTVVTNASAVPNNSMLLSASAVTFTATSATFGDNVTMTSTGFTFSPGFQINSDAHPGQLYSTLNTLAFAQGSTISAVNNLTVTSANSTHYYSSEGILASVNNLDRLMIDSTMVQLRNAYILSTDNANPLQIQVDNSDVLVLGSTSIDAYRKYYYLGSGNAVFDTLNVVDMVFQSGSTTILTLNSTNSVFTSPTVSIDATNAVLTNPTGDLTLSAQGSNILITGPLVSVNTAVTINGNLTVNGTTTTVNSTVVDIADNIIKLNSGPAASADSGVAVARWINPTIPATLSATLDSAFTAGDSTMAVTTSSVAVNALAGWTIQSGANTAIILSNTAGTSIILTLNTGSSTLPSLSSGASVNLVPDSSPIVDPGAVTGTITSNSSPVTFTAAGLVNTDNYYVGWSLYVDGTQTARVTASTQGSGVVTLTLTDSTIGTITGSTNAILYPGQYVGMIWMETENYYAAVKSALSPNAATGLQWDAAHSTYGDLAGSNLYLLGNGDRTVYVGGDRGTAGNLILNPGGTTSVTTLEISGGLILPSNILVDSISQKTPSGPGLTYNVDTAKIHNFRVNSTSAVSISSSTLTLASASAIDSSATWNLQYGGSSKVTINSANVTIGNVTSGLILSNGILEGPSGLNLTVATSSKIALTSTGITLQNATDGVTLANNKLNYSSSLTLQDGTTPTTKVSAAGVSFCDAIAQTAGPIWLASDNTTPIWRMRPLLDGSTPTMSLEYFDGSSWNPVASWQPA